MATRNKTIEFGFETRTALLATDTTLASAARHDFSAVTLYIPESGVTFQSVAVEVTARSAFTPSTSNITGWRIGIKLGAVAFNDKDYTPTQIANNGTQTAIRFSRDVTSYFTTNWSGTSMTCQIGFAVSTAAIRNVNNISAKLLITYAYDDSSGTHIKTIRIPIQSHHSGILNTTTEIGTTGGANNAPANQIPALDTFLPEASKVIRQAFLEFVGTDGRGNTTDFSLSVKIDSATPVVRSVLETAIVGSVWFRDIFIYDTATYSTASAHSVNTEHSIPAATRFTCIGAILVVTYEFDPAASSTILQSLILPLAGQDIAYTIPGAVSANASAFDLELWVEEPATITLAQSGILFWPVNNQTPVCEIRVWAGSQVERAYAFPALEASGAHWFVHRVDHGSGWTLARGKNLLRWSAYSNVSSDHTGVGGGYAIVNYTSGKHADGPGAHNRTIIVQACDYQDTGATSLERELASGSLKFPTLGAGSWWISELGMEKWAVNLPRSTAIANPENIRFKLSSGELRGAGWLNVSNVVNAPSFKDMGNYDSTLDLTSLFNRHDQAAGKMAVETARDMRIKGEVSGHSYSALRWLVTYHEIDFTVSGTITGYTGDGSGITVDVFTLPDDALITTVTSTAGGNYSATVYDNVNAHYAVARQDSTRVGRSDDVTPS